MEALVAKREVMRIRWCSGGFYWEPEARMRIHIVGMCGKIYAPLARQLRMAGHLVTGSDDQPVPPVSDYLADNGIFCFPNFSADHMDPATELVLANAAYPPDNVELVRARELGIPDSHFPRFLGETFLKHSRNIVVAGSYGKTTTASMAAWILEFAGLAPGWLVGGSCPNLPERVRLDARDWWVLEGDEYPSGPDDPAPKFRYYHPEIGVLTAIDHVHQDKFPTFGAVESLFHEFIGSIKEGGALIAADTPLIRRMVKSSCKVSGVTVGFDKVAGITLSEPAWRDGRTIFTLKGVRFSLALRGRIACLNASLAALAAEAAGIPLSRSAEALLEYQGVLERQEVIVETPQLTVIHDSGLYPRSLSGVVSGVTASSEGRRICVLFQPRYTIGDEELYYLELGRAFDGVEKLLIADAVNPPGIPRVFDFDFERFIRCLPAGIEARQIGPAMSCYPQWESDVRSGDTWLVLVEPLFPEPVRSIRSFMIPQIFTDNAGC